MKNIKDIIAEAYGDETDFLKVIDDAVKETGSKAKVPAKTVALCKNVGKYKINQLDLRGKKSGHRDVMGLRYQYYAYTLGWGHTKFTRHELATSKVKDPIIRKVYEMNKMSIFRDSTLQSHVQSDIEAYQIVANLSKGDTDVEPAYYLTKEYYNSFGLRVNSNRSFDYTLAKVSGWMEMNNIETL
jgi:hypothetical protein